MIVFSNTTPFIALSCINKLDLMKEIFSEIHVAESVIQECSAGGLIKVPNLSQMDWIRKKKDIESVSLPVLLELDKGEKQTIALALEETKALVLIDEKIGRNIAEYLGLRVTGTLGILVKAKRDGLIKSFTDEALSMVDAGIHYNIDLIKRIGRELGEI